MMAEAIDGRLRREPDIDVAFRRAVPYRRLVDPEDRAYPAAEQLRRLVAGWGGKPLSGSSTRPRSTDQFLQDRPGRRPRQCRRPGRPLVAVPHPQHDERRGLPARPAELASAPPAIRDAERQSPLLRFLPDELRAVRSGRASGSATGWQPPSARTGASGLRRSGRPAMAARAMSRLIAEWIWLIGGVLWFVIRLPHQRRARKIMVAIGRRHPDRLLLMSSLSGLCILPFIYFLIAMIGGHRSSPTIPSSPGRAGSASS